MQQTLHVGIAAIRKVYFAKTAGIVCKRKESVHEPVPVGKCGVMNEMSFVQENRRCTAERFGGSESAA
jgi:hypothetical protein